MIQESGSMKIFQIRYQMLIHLYHAIWIERRSIVCTYNEINGAISLIEMEDVIFLHLYTLVCEVVYIIQYIYHTYHLWNEV